MKFKVGDKVTSTWVENIGKTGTVSNKYEVLGLHGDSLKCWKKLFVLIEWSDGKISGESRRYVFKS